MRNENESWFVSISESDIVSFLRVNSSRQREKIIFKWFMGIRHLGMLLGLFGENSYTDSPAWIKICKRNWKLSSLRTEAIEPTEEFLISFQFKKYVLIIFMVIWELNFQFWEKGQNLCSAFLLFCSVLLFLFFTWWWFCVSGNEFFISFSAFSSLPFWRMKFD